MVGVFALAVASARPARQLLSERDRGLLARRDNATETPARTARLALGYLRDLVGAASSTDSLSDS